MIADDLILLSDQSKQERCHRHRRPAGADSWVSPPVLMFWRAGSDEGMAQDPAMPAPLPKI
jgi:hypothetical protein